MFHHNSKPSFTLVSPVVRVEELKIRKSVDMSGEKDFEWVAFDRKISWVREISSSIRFYHGGHLIKKGGGFCDVGRWGNCIEGAIKEAEGSAVHFGVTSESTMVIQVLAKAREIPTTGPVEELGRAMWGRTYFGEIPKGWMLDDMDQITACENAERNRLPWPENGMPALTDRKVAREVVWSSKNSPDENLALVEAFKAAWCPPTVSS